MWVEFGAFSFAPRECSSHTSVFPSPRKPTWWSTDTERTYRNNTLQVTKLQLPIINSDTEKGQMQYTFLLSSQVFAMTSKGRGEPAVVTASTDDLGQ